jgi:NADH-quinone oxidoreductase subunit A
VPGARSGWQQHDPQHRQDEGDHQPSLAEARGQRQDQEQGAQGDEDDGPTATSLEMTPVSQGQEEHAQPDRHQREPRCPLPPLAPPAHAASSFPVKIPSLRMLSQASETYYQSYGIILAVVVAGAGLVAVALLTARVLAPRRLLPEKLTTYECGIDPVGEGWSQSQIRYYIYAFLFVIFDVESVFLFPWATVFERLGYAAVVEMGIFILILAIGLLYAWRKGVLRWA